MNRRGKMNLAIWIEALARRLSKDPDCRVYEKDGRVYFADPGNKHGPELRRLSDAVLEGGGWGDKLSGGYVQQRILEVLLKVIDSQVVKTTRTGGPERGYDGAKRLAGRKHSILVDTACSASATISYIIVSLDSLKDLCG